MIRYNTLGDEDVDGVWVRYEDVKTLELNLVVVRNQYQQVLDLVQRAIKAGEDLAKETNMPFWHLEQKSPDPKKMEAALREILRFCATDPDRLHYIARVAEEALK